MVNSGPKFALLQQLNEIQDLKMVQHLQSYLIHYILIIYIVPFKLTRSPLQHASIQQLYFILGIVIQNIFLKPRSFHESFPGGLSDRELLKLSPSNTRMHFYANTPQPARKKPSKQRGQSLIGRIFKQSNLTQTGFDKLKSFIERLVVSNFRNVA